jgi:hypothetical protein
MTSPTVSLSYQARREVLAAFLPRYHAASPTQKSLLLDRFVQMTGYARKSAIRLLNHPQSRPVSSPSSPPRHDHEVQQALREPSTPELGVSTPCTSLTEGDEEIYALPTRSGLLTIAGAIQAYLEAQREAGGSSKSLE